MARRATTEQVAAALNVGPATIRKYAREHRLPYDTTPGGHRRFDVDEAVAAILGGRREGTPPTAEEDAGGDSGSDLPAVPYVHVEPHRDIIARTVVMAVDEAAVGVYDNARDVEDWSRQTPVV